MELGKGVAVEVADTIAVRLGLGVSVGLGVAEPAATAVGIQGSAVGVLASISLRSSFTFPRTASTMPKLNPAQAGEAVIRTANKAMPSVCLGRIRRS